MEAVIEWVTQLPPVLVYVVTAVLVFTETGLLVGLVLPGEGTLIVAGFLASLGTIDPFLASAIMIVAGVAGDGLAFVQGRRVGPRVHHSRLGRWVGERRWARADAILLRHSGRAVFIGRFVAFVRTLMPRLCALAGMPYGRYLGWDLLGVTAQVASGVAIGYVAGGSYRLATELMGRATWAFVLLIVVLVALVVLGRYLGRHPDPMTALGQRMRGWGPLRRLGVAYEAVFRWLTRHAGVGGAVAVNLLLGVLLLLGTGVVLTLVIDRAVASSGFPLVDPLIVEWFVEQQSPPTMRGASIVLAILRGFFLVVAAGIVGLVINTRPTRWRADLLGVMGTVGAFLPLVVLAGASELTRPDTEVPPGLPLLGRSLIQSDSVPGGVVIAAGDMFGAEGLYGNQVTLVTASVGMVAWLLARRWPRWGVRVTCWIAAAGVVLVVSASRIYLGWNWPSEVVASILLGAAWVLVFAVAWGTRDRLRAADPDAAKNLTGTPGTEQAGTELGSSRE